MAPKKPRKIRKPAVKKPEVLAEEKTETSEEQISEKARQLLTLLKKESRTVRDLGKELDLSAHAIYDLAEELNGKGYDIRVFNKGEDKVFILERAAEEATVTEALPVSHVNRRLKILVTSEIRMGSKQAQISLLKWIYEVAERENVDCAFVAGGLVVGKPTPTLAPDILKSDANELVKYVVKHFPKSKRFKTYIIAGRSELSWKDKEGFDITSAICSQREDLSKAGDLQRTFDFRGVRVKVICPYDDNAPKGVSYGPQKIADNLRESPMPNILVVGGTHRRSRIPVYNGMYVETAPSLHAQMRRQARRGVDTHVGYTILELNYNPNWSFDPNTGFRVSLNALGAFVNPQDCYGVDMSLAANLDDTAKKVLDWFVKEPVLSEGELSRRLGQNKESVKKVVEKLVAVGYKIVFKIDSKRFELEVVEKEEFSPAPLKYEDLYQLKTVEAEISDTHYGSMHDMPEVVKKAFEDAVKAGARRIYHPGDFTDGPGSAGYRGHLNDVKFVKLDDLEDYTVANWPKVKVRATPEKPILVTKLVYDADGKFKYESTVVTEGEVWLQTDAIDGNHDEWAWKSVGHKITRSLAARLPEQIRYLGMLHGVAVVDGVFHKIVHPAGGLGYTLSYKLERHMAITRQRGEGIGMPTVVYLGNWHCAYLLFDDRLGMIVPCFKGEDEFHITRALLPYIGMFISEIYTNKESSLITRVISDYRNYYSMYLKGKKEERL